MSKRFHLILLLAAHLLLACLPTGGYLSHLLHGAKSLTTCLAKAGVGLALVLMTWMGTLLIRQLWRQGWLSAVALLFLLVADGLAFCVSLWLLLMLGMAAGPN